MATKVLVPRLGEGVDEVTVTKWLKQLAKADPQTAVRIMVTVQQVAVIK